MGAISADRGKGQSYFSFDNIKNNLKFKKIIPIIIYALSVKE